MSDDSEDAAPAPCGFGYAGRCCCECALRLTAKPRCHHLGGKGACGKEPDPAPITYVCMAFAHEGIAQTDWQAHGCCENWEKRL